MYLQREIKKQVFEHARSFPVIVITGPRQSGKTTFIQNNFPDFTYFNLEDPSTRNRIEADPVGFFRTNPENIVIDEIQRIPDLLSYIQVHVDTHHKMGSIIVSGSQNLLISERISQSLAGRAAYSKLLPLSQNELRHSKYMEHNYLQYILNGNYPAIFSRNIAPRSFYSQYIATYVERDVRMIKAVDDLSLFQKFMQLLAGRIGNILNVSSLANDVGISPNTVESWLSVLEASYIVFRLQPYYDNVGKRLIKSPKIYFYDTGVLTTLLNIDSTDELSHHYAIGNIFENMIITEILKKLNNNGSSSDLYFYRDNHGNEIDVVVDAGLKKIPIEIKSSATYNKLFHKGLNYWRDHIDSNAKGFIVYGNTESFPVNNDSIVGWNELDTVYGDVEK